MSQPLWPETNKTIYSNVFSVPAGNVCLLYATGMSQYKYRESNETFLSPQSLCVRRLVYDFDKDSKALKGTCGCDWIFDINAVQELLRADDLVNTGCCWTLTVNRNIGIIGLPGTYVLELNDSTAIGDVQVYADLYGIKDIAPQVSNMFFQ